jgi:hypothetical protein
VNGFRKWLYARLMNVAARVAPVEVRVLHNEVLVRGMESAETARGIEPGTYWRSVSRKD